MESLRALTFHATAASMASQSVDQTVSSLVSTSIRAPLDTGGKRWSPTLRVVVNREPRITAWEPSNHSYSLPAVDLPDCDLVDSLMDAHNLSSPEELVSHYNTGLHCIHNSIKKLHLSPSPFLALGLYLNFGL